jgi:hypothetical protein
MSPGTKMTFAAMAAALFLGGCGPKVDEVLVEQRPGYEKVQAQLRAIVQKLPAPGSVPMAGGTVGATLEAPGPQLSPAPVYDGKNAGASNTAWFDSVEAVDPNAKPAYDLILSSDLKYGIGYTKVPSTLSESVLKQRAKNWGARLQEPLGRFQYVVITRPVKHVPAEAISETAYKAGSLDLEWFLAELKSAELKASGRFQVLKDEKVEYSFRKGEDDKKERLAGFANSTIYTAARKKLVEQLRVKTGGKFVAD